MQKSIRDLEGELSVHQWTFQNNDLAYEFAQSSTELTQGILRSKITGEVVHTVSGKSEAEVISHLIQFIRAQYLRIW